MSVGSTGVSQDSRARLKLDAVWQRDAGWRQSLVGREAMLLLRAWP